MNPSKSPDQPVAKVVARLSEAYANQFSRMTYGPKGVYFGCDGSIWWLEDIQMIYEYARVKQACAISGLCFHRGDMLNVSTAEGDVFRIDSNRGGGIVAQLKEELEDAEQITDIAVGSEGQLFASSFSPNRGSILRVGKWGTTERLCSSKRGTTALLLDGDVLWCVESGTASIVKRSVLDGSELGRIAITENLEEFSPPENGIPACSIAKDNANNLYVAARRSGRIFCIDSAGHSTVFVSNLNNPTGVAVDPSDQSIFVLESGKSCVLRYSRR